MTKLAESQAGVISRAQALGLGMSPDQIKRSVGTSWQRSDHTGVYLTMTGPVPYLSRCWAALLHAGDGAALSLETAAWVWGLLDEPPATVHVMVDGGRRLARQQGVRFHIRTHLAGRIHPARLPAVVRLEETVLDMVDRRSTTELHVIDLVLRACQRRLTSPRRIELALAGRRKIRHRTLVLDMVSEVRDGVQSALELRYVRRVEGAHGLPRGQRNLAEGRRGRRRYRDVRYLAYRLVVELDGQAAHPEDKREDDDLRDNELVLDEATRTLRYGWRSVTALPCETASQVARLLRSGGWPCTPRRCGPACRLDHTS